MVVLNLYVGIKILVETFNTNHSITYITQKVNRCCSPKRPDTVVESALGRAYTLVGDCLVCRPSTLECRTVGQWEVCTYLS